MQQSGKIIMILELTVITLKFCKFDIEFLKLIEHSTNYSLQTTT